MKELLKQEEKPTLSWEDYRLFLWLDCVFFKLFVFDGTTPSE